MKNNYQALKKSLIKVYSKNITHIQETLPAGKLRTVWDKYNSIVFESYSSQLWYLSTQIIGYIDMRELALEVNEQAGDELDELQDLLFESWNKSEFAKDFLGFLNKGHSIKKASLHTLKIVDQHLAILFQRIVLDKDIDHKYYHENESLGEIRQKGKLTHLPYLNMRFETCDLLFHYHSKKEKELFPPKILIALTLIEHFSPTSFERFEAFTQTIIPIKQKEFVSYSHQELPGTSMINLYHRDFVDLLDDLLHENGHHHLNYYLNQYKLIDEPIENIYYSPWRETLRPIRGIYHAYFTFFWAFKLFKDLSEKDLSHPYYEFSKDEKDKIYRRAIEEFLMLDYTFADLKKAHQNKIITKRGMDLVQELQDELIKSKSHTLGLKKKLSKESLKRIHDLEETLKKAAKHYR